MEKDASQSQDSVQQTQQTFRHGAMWCKKKKTPPPICMFSDRGRKLDNPQERHLSTRKRRTDRNQS